MTPDQHAEWLTTRVDAARAHIPPQFAGATLDGLNGPELQAWCEQQIDGDPRNLLLSGAVGTGKTHAAWACWPHLIGLGWVGSWVVLSELELLDAYLPGGDRGRADRALGANLLMLDDLGTAALSDWSRSRLTALIDYRWQHRKATIVTSNLAPAKLAAHLGERATSRLAADATSVRMLGADRRTT